MSLDRQRQSDFWDIIHIYQSNFYKKFRAASYHYILSPSKAIIYILKNIVYFLFWRKKLIIKKEEVKNKTWLLCSSLNNYNSLKFLGKKLEDSIFITTNTYHKKSNLKDINRLSFHYNLIHLNEFPRNFIKVIQQHGFFGFKIIDVIIESSGMINTCLKILQQGKPKAIVFANDHNLKNRSLLLAAKSLNIPTIYIQHASVSHDFPPLKFDLNLLEGQDSLNKYKMVGEIEGLVKLIGMPKFDGYSQFRRTQKSIHNIGICTNVLDLKKDIINIIGSLHDTFPKLKITYRPHPNDRRNIQFPKYVHISDSKNEMIFDFLKNQDFIIAGNSSLHLEAALINVLSVYYMITPDGRFNDHYGYVKNQLIQKVDNKEELKNYIQTHLNNKTDVWQKAIYYNAAIGNNNGESSQTLVIQAINSYLGSRN